MSVNNQCVRTNEQANSTIINVKIYADWQRIDLAVNRLGNERKHARSSLTGPLEMRKNSGSGSFLDIFDGRRIFNAFHISPKAGLITGDRATINETDRDRDRERQRQRGIQIKEREKTELR